MTDCLTDWTNEWMEWKLRLFDSVMFSSDYFKSCWRLADGGFDYRNRHSCCCYCCLYGTAASDLTRVACNARPAVGSTVNDSIMPWHCFNFSNLNQHPSGIVFVMARAAAVVHTLNGLQCKANIQASWSLLLCCYWNSKRKTFWYWVEWYMWRIGIYIIEDDGIIWCLV